ncbi:MAG: hypothetical protein UIC64_02755 [Agathobacter sp.]|nr:hypothetical protein [Agathobacter sp.]
MSAQTKIFVLHKNKVAFFSLIFALVAIIFLLLFAKMQIKKVHNDRSTPTSTYIPGTYTSEISLNGTNLEIEVVLSDSEICSVSFTNLDENTESMYPLLQPAMADLSSQVISNQSLENLTYSEDAQYTSIVLINAIRDAISKSTP